MKKLLFIGAGWEQEELIKTAKIMGYEVIATHPHLDEQVVPLVDRYFVSAIVFSKIYILCMFIFELIKYQ